MMCEIFNKQENIFKKALLMINMLLSKKKIIVLLRLRCAVLLARF
jgi:hypothetical protein